MRLLCFMGEEVSPPEEFSEIAVWKMQQRKRDMEDIASGRRTPERLSAALRHGSTSQYGATYHGRF